MNLSVSVVSPNPINYPSPSPSPQPPPPSPSPESERAQTPPPPPSPESERAQPQPPSPESEKPFSKFLRRSKEERDKLLDEVLSKVIKKMREDRENGYEAPPSDPEHHNPGFRWRRERGLSVPDDYAWKEPPEHNPDDWKDVPVIPYMPPDDPHCEICGRLHPKTCCPYLYEFPADGVLRNTSDYLIVCECGQDAVDGRCPNETCAPSNIRLVIRKPSSPKYDDCSTSDDSP